MDAKTGVWMIRNNNNRRHVSKSAHKDPFGLRNLPLNAADGPEQHDVFYSNIAPVVKLLRALGALPIRNLPVNSKAAAVSGCRASFSPVMLWSVCVYVGLISALWFAYSQGFFESVDAQSFDNAVLQYQDFAYHLIDLAVPINNWREARMVAAYMASWSAFQCHYRVVTGRALDINFRRQTMTLTVVLVTVTCGRETVYQVLEKNLKSYLVLITYWYQALIRDTMGLMWYLLCRLLRISAQHLAASFQKDVETAARPHLVIARYNALWLQFSHVVRQTGVATCHTYGFYVLYLFLMLTVSMYGLLSTVVKGFDIRLVYLVGDSLISGTELYIICDCANSVTREVGLIFQERLLDFRQMPLGDKVEKEVDAFLKTIDLRPPDISFGGYVTVNRGMLLSLGSMMVTYLVVLLQLGIAGTSGRKDAANDTTSSPS